MYQITGAIVIFALCFYSFIAKKRRIRRSSSEIDYKADVIDIDYLLLYVYAVYCLTIIGALVIFKVLDRRHGIKIKKF